MDQKIEPRILDAIEEAIKRGIPLHYLASALIQLGWPQALVIESLNTWQRQYAYGTVRKRTDFKLWLQKYHQAARPAVIVMVILNTINTSILLLRPWPTKIMIDSAFGDVPAPLFLEALTQTPALILVTSLMTMGIFLANTLFGLLKDYLILKLGFRLNRAIKHESFRHILHLPLYHQERLAKGDYIYRQNVVTSSLADLVLGTTSSIAESIIMVVGILFVMLFFNAQLTIIGIVTAPFVFIIMRIFGPRLSKLALEMTKVASRTSSAITEAVDNAETVQSFALEDAQLKHVDSLWVRNFELSRKRLVWARLFRGTNSLIIIIATAAVMYFGGIAVINGKATAGELLIFMSYMGFLLSPIENLATQLALRGQKLMDVHRVFEVLADHEGIENLRQGRHFPVSHGNIEFRKVSYAYNDSVIFNDVDLTISSGEKVAIIGPSGGGKSTILKLLPLFVEPGGGQILIDGIDTQTISLKELRRNIAWISQSPQLFNKPLIDNLLDGDLYHTITPQEIQAALTVANVTEFLSKLPMGVETPSGEGGGSLSGGQRQRVAVARGLLKHAPIICMDEPTAALDYKSEKVICDSLGSQLAGKTVMLVTHRKALLKLMDTVYILEGGQLQNVKEVGGLDAYLERLEGIKRQEAEKPVEREEFLTSVPPPDRRTAERTEVAAAEAKTVNPLAPAGDRFEDDTLYINHDS